MWKKHAGVLLVILKGCVHSGDICPMEFQKDRNINKQWTSTQNKRVESSSRTSADHLCRFGHNWGTIYIGFFICFLRIIIAALSHEIFKRVLHRNALFWVGNSSHHGHGPLSSPSAERWHDCVLCSTDVISSQKPEPGGRSLPKVTILMLGLKCYPGNLEGTIGSRQGDPQSLSIWEVTI